MILVMIRFVVVFFCCPTRIQNEKSPDPCPRSKPPFSITALSRIGLYHFHNQPGPT